MTSGESTLAHASGLVSEVVEHRVESASNRRRHRFICNYEDVAAPALIRVFCPRPVIRLERVRSLRIRFADSDQEERIAVALPRAKDNVKARARHSREASDHELKPLCLKRSIYLGAGMAVARP